MAAPIKRKFASLLVLTVGVLAATAEEAGQSRPVEKPPTRTDGYGDPLPAGAIARIGTVRLRHGEAALRVTFSPDGKTLASAGLDGTLRRWDTATGKQLWRFERFDGLNFAYSPDGQTFAAGGVQKGGGGGPIRLWDLVTGREKLRFKGGVSAFSPDGKTLAVSVARNGIQLYDTSTGQTIRPPLKGQPSQIRALLFSADGKKLVSIGGDKTMRVWNAATGEQLHPLQGHRGMVCSAALSPDGKVLASGSDDQAIRLWDMASGKELRRLEQPGVVHAVAFSHDGKTFAVGGSDRSGHAVPGRVCYGFLDFWDAVEMKPRRRIGVRSSVSSIAFAPDDRMLASTQDMSIRFWNTATGEEVPRAGDHSANTCSMAVSADGRTVAVGSIDDSIRLCDMATGKVIRRLPLDPDVLAAESLSFSADGKTLASTGPGVDPKCKLVPKGFDLWDIATGKKVRRAPEALVYPLTLSPDGKTVAAGVVGKIVLFDAATGKELRQLSGWPGNPNMLAFSPDSKLLAAVDVGKAALWDVGTGKEVRAFPASAQQCGALAFSPDGKLLAVTSYERGKGAIVRLWDVATGAERWQLSQPNGSFQVVAFSPDGRSVAAGHSYREHTVHLWETSTGQRRREWKGHDGRIWAVAFSPDGKRLLSGGFDTSVLVWDVLGQSVAGSSGPLSSEQLRALWTDLASEDAAKAFESIGQLSASAKQAVSLLKDKLRPAPEVSDQRQVARLIVDLGSDEFAVREKAMEQLRQLDERAEPGLREALKDKLTLEARKRIAELLEGVRISAVSPQRLRDLRAIEVLEHLDTADARQLLKTLADGAPHARLTREAKASLERLAKRFGSANRQR